MKSYLKVTTWVTSAVIALSSISTSAMALPIVSQQVDAGASNVIQVQDRHLRRQFERERRPDFRRDRHMRRHVDRHRRGEWRGYRGYRGPRHGYRRHSDGWWYPLAAFGLGATVGGALSNPPARARGLSNNHYNWCAQRYRTYRASDNSYVPSAGVRAQCVSPYS